MAVNHTYDELAGHRVVVAPMAEARPLWRSTLVGAYIELVSVMMRAAVAAVEGGAENAAVEGLVTRGDVIMIEPWATDELIDGLVRYGYMTPAGHDAFRLIRHEKLIHWKMPKQAAWEKRARQDTRDEHLKAKVRHRDGDQCRVCRDVVKWGVGPEDPLGGTLDHRHPGTPADGNPDMLAVACRRCNGIRSNRADADAVAPWQDVPTRPYYTKATAVHLRDMGYKGTRPTGKTHLLPRITITARPAAQADTALTPSDPAPSGTTRTPETRDSAPQGHDEDAPGQRPRTHRDNAPQGKRPAAQADTAPTPSDPAPSGTTRTPSRPETDSKSTADRSATSPPAPAPPRSNPAPKPTPLAGDGREGNGRGGSGGEGQPGPSPRRPRRSRRSKSKPTTEKP